MKKKILVAIPTYNCERQIGRVLRGFNNKLLNMVDKIIVIDNISKDNTVAAAKEAIKKLRTDKIEVWQNRENYNLGGSHKVAFLAGERLGMDYVAILHGDNQATTEELENLINIAKDHPEYGAILGCRFMKGSKRIGYAWQRVYGNIAINIIYSIVTIRPSRDLGSGLNLFRIKDLSDHRYLGFGDNMTFNIDLLLDYFRKNTPIKFTPISWKEEDQVSNARNFSIGTIALKKLLYWRVDKEQIHSLKPTNYYKSGKI